MKKFLKFGVLPVATFVSLLVLTIVLLPVLINVQKLVPTIERQVSERTGRAFSIGSDVSISLFPWLSISFSDLKLGNPAGFSNNDSLQIESFEGRIALLPLMSKRIVANRFVLGGVQVNVETNERGDTNWDLSPENINETLENVAIDLFAITNGSISWTDSRNQRPEKYEAEDFMILAKNFRIDKPFTLDAKATASGRVMSMNGTMGPLSFAPKSNVSVNLSFDLAKTMQGKVKGKVFLREPGVDLRASVSPFVPGKLGAALVGEGKGNTFFAGVESAEFNGHIRGNHDNFEIIDGVATLDGSEVKFGGRYSSINSKKVNFELSADRLITQDLFGNLEIDGVDPESNADFLNFMRSVDFKGRLDCRELVIQEGSIYNLNGTVAGQEGNWTIEPLTFAMYGGTVNGKAIVNFQEKDIETRMAIEVNDVSLSPALKGFFDLDLFEGKVSGEGSFGFSGLAPEKIFSSITGKAGLQVENGSFAGFDLLDIYRGGKSQFVGFAPGTAHSIRTPFAEMDMTLVARNGIFELVDSSLQLATVVAEIGGIADFNQNVLDVSFVNPRKRQGADGPDDIAISAPVYLTGEFQNPLLAVGDTIIPQNGVLVANAVEVENLVAEKVPSPADEDVKNLVGKTLIDPLVIAERIGLALPGDKKKLTGQDVEAVSVSRIRIHPLREELAM